MDMTFDLVERSRFESMRDYPNNCLLHSADSTQSFDRYKFINYYLKNKGTE